jgi:uncharacterized protein
VGRIAVQMFEECLRVWMGEPAGLCIMAETCGRVLAMEHDGSVYACDHFVDPGHRLGDLSRDPLATLVDAPGQVAFGDAKRDALPSTCRKCPVLFVCNGGCPKDRFMPAPGGEGGLNYLCAGYRRFYEHVAPYMTRMVTLSRKTHASAIMAELKLKEADEEAPWRRASRNDLCPCGSGRKYKHCCLGSHRPR